MTDEHLQPYREAIRTHGGGFDATLWGSPQTQVLRFEVLTDMLGDALADGVTIVDLGCGDGAFGQWLQDTRGIRAYVHGLDAMGEMIEAAKARRIDGATFSVCNLVEHDWPIADTADIVLLSGTLNTMDDATTADLLKQAWLHTATALAFNFLGDAPSARWRDRPLGPARRHSVDSMKAWAQSCSTQVTCRSDYLDGHDVTLCLRRGSGSRST